MSSIQQQRLQQPAQPPEGASYEDLRRQVQALNEAFGTISDVLVEEVDAIRSEMARRHEHIECEIKSVREQVARVSTEVAEVRTQLTGGASVGVSINQLEKRRQHHHQLCLHLPPIGSSCLLQEIQLRKNQIRVLIGSDRQD